MHLSERGLLHFYTSFLQTFEKKSEAYLKILSRPVLPYSRTKSTRVFTYLEAFFLPSTWSSLLLVCTRMDDPKLHPILTCLLAGWLWGKDPGASTGELAGLQSSGKGFGMAGKDDVLNCCSSSWRRLTAMMRTGWERCTFCLGDMGCRVLDPEAGSWLRFSWPFWRSGVVSDCMLHVEYKLSNEEFMSFTKASRSTSSSWWFREMRLDGSWKPGSTRSRRPWAEVWSTLSIR